LPGITVIYLEFGVLLASGKIFFEYRRYYVYNILDMQALCAADSIRTRLGRRIVYSIDNIQLI